MATAAADGVPLSDRPPGRDLILENVDGPEGGGAAAGGPGGGSLRPSSSSASSAPAGKAGEGAGERPAGRGGWGGPVALDGEGKAAELRLLAPGEPCMRVFYLEVACIFSGQFSWFALAPLLSLAYADVGVPPSVRGLAESVGVLGAALGSLLFGAATDRFGPRTVHVALLCGAALPTGLVALAHSTAPFVLCRFLTSALGGSFTCGLAHTSAFFGTAVAGRANGLVGGLGGTGAALAALVMPQVAYLVAAASGLPLERAWRPACALPAALLLLAGASLALLTTDVRAGRPGPPRAEGKQRVGRLRLLREPPVLALAAFYACAAGAGIAMNAAMPRYYAGRFGVDIRSAGLLTFAGQVQIVYARALGGALADRAGRRLGPRGRVAVLVLFALGTAACAVAVAFAPTLEAAVLFAVALAACYHGSGGCNYAIIPLFGDSRRGAAGGLIGAGGGLGGTLFALLFAAPSLSLPDAFLAFAGVVAGVALLAPLVRFPELAARPPDEEGPAGLDAEAGGGAAGGTAPPGADPRVFPLPAPGA